MGLFKKKKEIEPEQQVNLFELDSQQDEDAVNDVGDVSSLLGGDNSDLKFEDDTNKGDGNYRSDATVEEDDENTHKEDYDVNELTFDEQEQVNYFVRALNDHFIRHNNADYANNFKTDDPNEVIDGEVFETVKQNLLIKCDAYFRDHNPKPAAFLIPYIRSQFIKRRWGYDRIDALLRDPDISDIKIYDYNDVRYKKLGKRYKANMAFTSRDDYKEFVSMVMTRNGVGQSDNNAVVKFTDTLTNKNFRIRTDIMTKYVSSVGRPYSHFRLVPKKKKSLDELERLGMFPAGTREYIIKHILDNKEGMLLTGKNGSGKTTLLNALIDIFDEQRSMMVIEDNQELFSETRGEVEFVHSVESRSTNKITYGMTDLAEQGLLNDIDIMVVGEVKNDSAKGIMKAAYVGVQPFTTSHGSSAIDGYIKLADYVKQATTYDLEDCLKYLVGFKLLIFMEDFKISQIVRNNGYTENGMSYTVMFDAARGGWQCGLIDIPYEVYNPYDKSTKYCTYEAAVHLKALKVIELVKNGEIPFDKQNQCNEQIETMRGRIYSEIIAKETPSNELTNSFEGEDFDFLDFGDELDIKINVKWPF